MRPCALLISVEILTSRAVLGSTSLAILYGKTARPWGPLGKGASLLSSLVDRPCETHAQRLVVVIEPLVGSNAAVLATARPIYVAVPML
ncbi:hypothetical protein BJY04DRAFT_78372 [Aspergillus karnatakaensis]|uniref:uncharacterized protein n=1 Tax=Aspergillus karnatakaensis TaxID=1810916 RepID=UPI003CCCF1C0